ncbi:MAG: biotin/lipoyl-binding protein [Thermoplasmata archaeon]|nr:biotin/lipoyl-binding protein [Thermoplasmata archaeon]
MKLEVTVDGETRTLEVDLERGVLHWKGREVPVKVVQDGFARVELEIAGEKFVVEGWPPGNPLPPGPTSVNGERYSATLVRSSASPVGKVPTLTPKPAAPPTPASRPSGEGTPVLPPMPGRVVEIRVRVGEDVAKGQVLLVLEAMKMRNEVAAPVTGTVAAVHVTVGANVRAGEPMVLLTPKR